VSDDHYETLGVGEDADPGEIRGAYRKKAKELHPDTSRPGKDAEDFLKVEKAYEVLSDTRKRRQYDLERRSERSAVDAAYSPSTVRPPGRSAMGGFPIEEIVETWFEERPTQYYRVLLSPREASAGVTCPLSCTVQRLCPSCKGRTFFDVFVCPVCRGAGTVEGETEVTLEIPAGVRHGTTFRLRSGGAFLEVEILVASD
jgi:molecular chaperone DnaJ